ncbi:ribonuclease M5 [Virgibacillus sp. W0430]|uniref:ribonuclease M5 n=1 Tax=Virgibacillus sp. W0430 TaxID=3391580 RepID=UPI003F452BE9
MKIKEVIIVEGKDDRVKIRQAVDADTIETNGSAINAETLERIKHAKEKRGCIIFTDPDYPGQRIRSIIDQAVPGCKHAFLTPEEARAKHPHNKSIGIEHASVAAIQKALAGVYEIHPPYEAEICQQDLLEYGLIGGSGAKERRMKLGNLLNIGQANGKQLLKRLAMFQITKKQLKQAMEEIVEEENGNA